MVLIPDEHATSTAINANAINEQIFFMIFLAIAGIMPKMTMAVKKIIFAQAKVDVSNISKYLQLLFDDSGQESFTAAAKITDDKIYQISMSDDFKPFRRRAEYENCNEVKIEPLIEELNFIRNKKSWGYMFRFGLFEINKHDFDLIYAKMKK